MSVIIPAILPATFEDLTSKLLRLQGVCKEVQVDVVDGKFVTPPTWPYAQSAQREDLPEPEELLPYLGSLHMEVDLMVADPEDAIDWWVRAGAHRVTVHAETTHNLTKLLEGFTVRYGHDKGFAPELISLGLAINIATDLSLIEPHIEQCDYVQFMGIARIGKQGEPFDRAVFPKIAAFRRKYPNTPISVDGGVSLATAPELLNAGVTRLVVGSALWRSPSLAESLKEFEVVAQEHGLYT